jgi:hypothetical protein
VEFLKRFAEHNGRLAENVWTEFKLSTAAMARNHWAQAKFADRKTRVTLSQL